MSRKKSNKKKFIGAIIVFAIIALSYFGISADDGIISTLVDSRNIDSVQTESVGTVDKESQNDSIEVDSSKDILSSIPEFIGEPYVEINGGKADFENVTTESYEKYSDLDSLGRCGVAEACVGRDIMPSEERGSIGMVKPSGWHTVKYDCVNGKYLYNRCHLIGYQLTGENANEKNLITGTRYLNIDGMLDFENDVAEYVEDTGNHVMYRVTPIYEGDNLVASGVIMEGYSVEDNGQGINFNVYCYNAQPGVGIDYATGESWLE